MQTTQIFNSHELKELKYIARIKSESLSKLNFKPVKFLRKIHYFIYINVHIYTYIEYLDKGYMQV